MNLIQLDCLEDLPPHYKKCLPYILPKEKSVLLDILKSFDYLALPQKSYHILNEWIYFTKTFNENHWKYKDVVEFRKWWKTNKTDTYEETCAIKEKLDMIGIPKTVDFLALPEIPYHLLNEIIKMNINDFTKTFNENHWMYDDVVEFRKWWDNDDKPDLLDILKTVDFLALQEIPYHLLNEIITMNINDFTKTFNGNHWVYNDVVEFRKWWDNDNKCTIASKNGNLRWLKFARKNGCPWDEDTIANAAKYGHLECLKWAMNNGCPWDENTTASAAANGHLECLKWVRKNGCPWNWKTTSFAAKYGYLECLKWARENGCPWNEETSTSAAANGHLECLKWAKENECPWNESTTRCAAANGHLECLKWLRENGCPWNEDTTNSAALNKHLECLKWAIKNGCPCNKRFLKRKKRREERVVKN